MQSFNRPNRASQRRWGVVNWWYSLILIVPILGIGATVIYSRIDDSNSLRGVVLDAYTDQPVAGASVATSATQIASDSNGKFQLPAEVSEVLIQKDGYDPTQVTVTPGVDELSIRLRPNVVQGTVVNVASRAPLAGISIEVRADGQTVSTATTQGDGSFLLVDIPENAELFVDSPDYSSQTIDLTRETQVEVALRPDVLVGRVTDQNGAPVEGASIVVGEGRATSDADGKFRLEGAPEQGEIIVKRPGYLASTLALDPSMQVDVTLTRQDIKALYATAGTAGDPALLNGLLESIEATEANALVVDVKDSSGFVFIDTKVALAHEIDAVRPAYDPAEMVRMLHERNIYAIARIVVFEDPVLAEAKPEWAIKDSSNGDLWRTWNGLAWVNAHRSEVWDYNIALVKEIASYGFDEVQLDYMRFPSDGPLNRADYGVEHNDETRPAAITEFLQRTKNALANTPTYLTGDVFGLTLWELGDGGIGQHLESFAPILDYIHPMVYPSHFYPGSMGFEIPNDHPYEVILWSLENGVERIPQYKDKLRPWLQDFSYGVGISYGDREVRLQIDACNDFGSTGWMLWNPANVYSVAALDPQ